MSHNRQKKIAVINDFSGFGRCSIAVSLPIISALKIQCCPLPTSIFSNHTGFESFFYTDYTAHMDRYMQEWEKLDLRFHGILTGFLGSPEQIQIVKRFLERFKTDSNITEPTTIESTQETTETTTTEAPTKEVETTTAVEDVFVPQEFETYEECLWENLIKK